MVLMRLNNLVIKALKSYLKDWSGVSYARTLNLKVLMTVVVGGPFTLLVGFVAVAYSIYSLVEQRLKQQNSDS